LLHRIRNKVALLLGHCCTVADSAQSSIDCISTTLCLTFTYEHQFVMEITENNCCPVKAWNRAGSAQCCTLAVVIIYCLP